MTWTRSKLATAACGPIALLLVICLPAHAQFPPTACRLLSPADVEQALHVPVGHGHKQVNTELLTSCNLTAGNGGSVSILLRRKVSMDWVTEQKRRMSGPGSFRTVRNFGDSAFVLDRREEGAALCVFRGEYYLQISVFRLGSANTVLPATEELARKALSRL